MQSYLYILIKAALITYFSALILTEAWDFLVVVLWMQQMIALSVLIEINWLSQFNVA